MLTLNLENIRLALRAKLFLFVYPLLLLTVAGVFTKLYIDQKVKIKNFSENQVRLEKEINKAQKDLKDFQNIDQVKVNKTLKEEIKSIHDDYSKSVKSYQQILDLKDQKQDTKKLDSEFAQTLSYLSDNNYASASATLADIEKQITEINQKIAQAAAPPAAPGGAPAPANNTPPSSGYSRQSVQTDVGVFTVDIISADLNSTKVIVDTASSSDCHNNCPTLPLADYVSRNGAYAGVNGSFFCPDTYPSCAGKTGSFDTLLMNKDKHYFNSDNNVYSVVPAAIFSNGWARFVSRSLELGRDTGVDSIIANYPLLVAGGNISFSSNDDPKFNGKGTRDFIAAKGNIVYIGTIWGATMSEAAHVLKTLGMDGALNLDEGGSTALWFGGYKAGPGRNIPNAVLFVRR